MMGSLYYEIWVTNLAVCWNSSTLVSTLYSENLTSFAQSAGNGWLLTSITLVHTSASETTSGKSFNYDAFVKAGGIYKHN